MTKNANFSQTENAAVVPRLKKIYRSLLVTGSISAAWTIVMFSRNTTNAVSENFCMRFITSFPLFDNSLYFQGSTIYKACCRGNWILWKYNKNFKLEKRIINGEAGI